MRFLCRAEGLLVASRVFKRSCTCSHTVQWQKPAKVMEDFAKFLKVHELNDGASVLCFS